MGNKLLTKICIFNFLFLVIIANTFSQTLLEKRYQLLVEPFVEAVKNNDKEKIIDLINYPLKRQYPIPDIYNKEEMIKRYNQIFDETLTNLVKDSSVKTDWHAVGWRGIIFNDGLIRIDYDGKIHGINYQSSQEKEVRKNIILEQKNNLHESLREFEEPSLLCEIKTYIIRIDYLGNDNYRLALWTKEKKQHENPGMVLTNGKVNFVGSGGNHHYIFVHDNYQYILTIDVMDKDYYGEFIIYSGMDKRWFDMPDKEKIILKEKIIPP